MKYQQIPESLNNLKHILLVDTKLKAFNCKSHKYYTEM